MITIETLENKIEQAKDLDFGSIFSASIELFKKVWLQGFVTVLLSMLLMLPFYILMYIPLIAMGVMDPEALNSGGEPNWAIMLPFYGMAIIFSFFAMIIGVGLKAAFFRICKSKDLNTVVNDDYFYFFKKPYFGKTCKIGAISFGLIIGAYVLCFFPVIYIMVPVTIINVIYAFNPDMSASDIVKASFKLGNKKWLIIFGLTIISGFLAGIVGMIMCFFGVLFTSSFASIPVYYIYKEAIGFDGKTEIEQIGSGE